MKILLENFKKYLNEEKGKVDLSTGTGYISTTPLPKGKHLLLARLTRTATGELEWQGQPKTLDKLAKIGAYFAKSNVGILFVGKEKINTRDLEEVKKIILAKCEKGCPG
jgi:hypothetical protein